MTNCGCEELRLVSYSILFTKRGLEVTFPEVQEMVAGYLSPLNFQTWKIAEFVQSLPDVPVPPKWRIKGYPPTASQGRINALPLGDEKYLSVQCRLDSCYPREPLKFREDQLEELAQIRDAIEEKQAVRLPESMKLTGFLNPSKSGFIPQFLNFPSPFGPLSEAAVIRLTGRVEIEFQQPEDGFAEFEIRYSGLGSPSRMAFQGGQEYDLLRNRSFSNPSWKLPDGRPLKTGGRLNLKTGEAEGLQINAILQNSTVAQFNRLNRTPLAIYFLYPPLGLPASAVPQLPSEPAEGRLEFICDDKGRIAEFELHSKSIIPAALLPDLPGFFPPFCFGPAKAVFFPNPARCREETPEEDCPGEITHPDGVKLPSNALFQVQFELAAEGLEEAGASPGQAGPEAGTVLVGAGEGLYRVRPSSEEDQGGRTEAYDRHSDGWVLMPALPGEEGSGGGWTGAETESFPAAAGVLNGAGAAAAPSALSPGSRAILWGFGWPFEQPQGVKIKMGGRSATILAQRPGRIDFLVPEIELKGKSRKVRLEMRSRGSSRPFKASVELRPAAPGLFIQNNGELFDLDYLNECAAVACNQDGSFNCPSQPARPAEEVTLYAAGLGDCPREPSQLRKYVRVLAGPTGRAAQVLGVSDLEGQPGVKQIRIRLPAELPALSNNLLILLFANRVKANAAVIAVHKKASRLDPALTCKQGLKSFFPPA